MECTKCRCILTSKDLSAFNVCWDCLWVAKEPGIDTDTKVLAYAS